MDKVCSSKADKDYGNQEIHFANNVSKDVA